MDGRKVKPSGAGSAMQTFKEFCLCSDTDDVRLLSTKALKRKRNRRVEVEESNNQSRKVRRSRQSGRNNVYLFEEVANPNFASLTVSNCTWETNISD